MGSRRGDFGDMRDGGYPPRRDDYSRRDDRDYPRGRDDYPPQRDSDYPPSRRDDYPPPSRDRRDDYPPLREDRGGYPRRDDYPPRREDRRDDYPPSRRDDRRDDYPPSRQSRDPPPRYRDEPPQHLPPSRNSRDDYPPPTRKEAPSTTQEAKPHPLGTVQQLKKAAPHVAKTVQPPRDLDEDDYPTLGATPRSKPIKKETTAPSTASSIKLEPQLAPAKPGAQAKKEVYLGPPKSFAPASVQRRTERGKVTAIKDRFGFIKSNSGESLYFHFNSVEGGIVLRERDDVEFMVVEERAGPTAVNIRSLGVVSILDEKKSTSNSETKSDKSSSLLPAWMMASNVMPSSQSAPAPIHEEPVHHHDEESLSKRRMLDWIKTIDEGDPETLLLHMNVLSQVLNSDEMPFTVVQPLVLILTREELLDSERTDKVYTCVLESKFLRNPRNLRAYILKLCSSKHPSAEDTHAFQQVLVLLQEVMDRCRTYRDLPLDALDPSRCAVFPGSIASQVERLNKTAASIRQESTQSMINTNWAPQEEDFRDIPIFPTTEEILGIKSDVVDGKFDNAMHYLDTHFRLLREDCLQPLREGIQAYRNSADTRDVRVYTNVRIRGIMCARTGLVYRVSFDTDRPVDWSKSKRLIYGSLLCLSPDKFDTLLWATVSNRDDSLLTTKKQIDIQFPAGYEVRFDPTVTYSMAESVTTYLIYFEAYQHVLKALQQLDLERFPFKEYLISCQSAVQSPSYLRGVGNANSSNTLSSSIGIVNTGGADKYNLSSVLDGGKTTFPLLGQWPEIETTMDNSQQNAFKQALCKEFAIIQGPPGTGKTFVGLKVMRALLDNRHLRRKGPILVVCFTNHALDQFLEGIMEFEENIVRIGSRSKSERLRARNIRQLTYETAKRGQQHKARKAISQQLDLIQKEITDLVADMNRKDITVEDVLRHISDDQYDSLIGMKRNPSVVELTDILRHWLGEDPNKILTPKSQQPTALKSQNGSTKVQPAKPPVTMQNLPKVEVQNWADDAEEEVDDETLTNIQQERMVGDDETAGPSGDSVVELRGMCDFSMSYKEMPTKDVIECDDVWKLKTGDRRKLYKYWAGQSIRRSEEPLTYLSAQYDRYCRERVALEDDMKIEVLANSAVIGMTTTGVAKFHNLLQAVQPEIIIVEEAAEVLEAHIVVALSQSTKHVILIGDHEQLRPSTAVYQLSTKFHLDVSLFERMVRNNVEQVTLLRQRRMRPDISKLISPLYPKLDNHPYVSTYPDVLGVSANLYLVSHNVEEEKDGETGSKSNLHEALFLARLCEYLLLQGYKPEQITVLTPYCGQVRMLNKEFRKASSANLRITTVDNFQGEEADIILLSLVRSNPQGDIGFLKVSNRVCVALSRAKIGFYMIGNSSMLHRNKLWVSVLDILNSKQMVGPSLALRCQNHPQTTTYQEEAIIITYVTSEADFQKVSDGGCSLLCATKMKCGHVCPRLCHPYTHDKLLCQAPCSKRHIECGHPCERRCFEECGLCLVMVDKDLPCGHTARAPCAESRDTVRCMEPCERRLPCRHPCPKPCGEKCPRTCPVPVERDLPCGHVIPVPCSDDIRKFKCPKPCLSFLPCGHKCIGTCGECSKYKSGHLPCSECGGSGSGGALNS